jgi:hypothetical protein
VLRQIERTVRRAVEKVGDKVYTLSVHDIQSRGLE